MKRTLVGPLALILIWQAAVSLSGVSSLLIPGPTAVARAIPTLLKTDVLADVSWTLMRLAAGLALGSACGVLLGVVLGRFRGAYAAMEVTIDFFRSIPVAAMFPLFLVSFGIGDASKIATITWSVSLVVLVNTMYGVRHVGRLRIMAGQVLGAGQIRILTEIVIPDALPEIAVGLRQALSIGTIVAIMTEMLMGTDVGLGHRIFDAGLTYRVPEMYATILLAGALGYLLNKGFVLLESHFIHWTGR